MAPSTVKTSAAPPASRWQAVFNHLVLEEGSRFVDDPTDRGGATKAGLTLRFLVAEQKLEPQLIADLKIGHDGIIAVPDLRNLTTAQEEGVYFACFWTQTNICKLPQPFDAATFDQAVNDGVTAAVELLQQALNAVSTESFAPIPVDGALGPATIARCIALTSPLTGHSAALLTELRSLVAQRYRAIVARSPSQQKYLNGWLARAAVLGNV